LPAGKTVTARVLKKFVADKAPREATLLAWTTLLAMFPIVLAAAAILGLVLRTTGNNPSSAVYRDFIAIIPDRRARFELLRAIAQHAEAVSVISLVGLVISGSALFGTMDEAFARVYQIKARSFLRQKLMSVAMIAAFTLLVGLAVGSSALLPVLEQLSFLPHGISRGGTGIVIHSVLGIADGVLLFMIIYLVVPNRKLRVAHVIPGALLAGIMFEAITLMFPVYIRFNQSINAYGATFGLFFLLMAYFYLLGLITMLGAELNSVLQEVGVAPQVGAALSVSFESPS
jgi:membrane protein